MEKAKRTRQIIKDLLTLRKKTQSVYLTRKEQELIDLHKIKEIETFPPKPHEVQQNETDGKLPFDQGNYHCEEYNDLMKNVSEIRKQYSDSNDHSERKQLAGEEISHWHDYMNKRMEMLPDRYQINNQTLRRLRDIFGRESSRRNNRLTGDRVINYHHSFTLKYRFDIPIHATNLTQMIHPHYGYLTNVEDHEFTFDQMVDIYKQQIVSTYERDLGQTYLANELA